MIANMAIQLGTTCASLVIVLRNQSGNDLHILFSVLVMAVREDLCLDFLPLLLRLTDLDPLLDC